MVAFNIRGNRDVHCWTPTLWLTRVGAMGLRGRAGMACSFIIGSQSWASIMVTCLWVSYVGKGVAMGLATVLSVLGLVFWHYVLCERIIGFFVIEKRHLITLANCQWLFSGLWVLWWFLSNCHFITLANCQLLLRMSSLSTLFENCCWVTLANCQWLSQTTLPCWDCWKKVISLFNNGL